MFDSRGIRIIKVLHYVEKDEVIYFPYIDQILLEAVMQGYDVSEFPHGVGESLHEPIIASKVNDVVNWLIVRYPDEYIVK